LLVGFLAVVFKRQHGNRGGQRTVGHFRCRCLLGWCCSRARTPAPKQHTGRARRW
jgi:hypothetical protein